MSVIHVKHFTKKEIRVSNPCLLILLKIRKSLRQSLKMLISKEIARLFLYLLGGIR